MPALAETRTKRRATTRRKHTTTLRPEPTTMTLEIRRCISCGTMSTVDDGDLMFTETLTLDGIPHELATCRDNPACTYQAHVLRERLEFRDIEVVHINPNPERVVMREFVLNDEDFNVFQEVCNSIRGRRQAMHPGEVLTDEQCFMIMTATYDAIPSHRSNQG